MTIIGIDPGPTESGLVGWRDGRYVEGAMISLGELDRYIAHAPPDAELVIEDIAGAYTPREGQYIGHSVIETAKVIGYLVCMWMGITGRKPKLVYRKTLVAHLCGNAKANDRDVRAALIDRYGGDPKVAIGTKKQPGPLHGLTKDMLQAAALVEWYKDTHGTASDR